MGSLDAREDLVAFSNQARIPVPLNPDSFRRQFVRYVCYPANAIESIHFWFDRVRRLRRARDRLHRSSSVYLIEVRAELISKILGVQLSPHDPGEARPWGKDADRAAGAPPVGDPDRRLRDHAVRAPAPPRRRHLHRRRV